MTEPHIVETLSLEDTLSLLERHSVEFGSVLDRTIPLAPAFILDLSDLFSGAGLKFYENLEWECVITLSVYDDFSEIGFTISNADITHPFETFFNSLEGMQVSHLVREEYVKPFLNN